MTSIVEARFQELVSYITIQQQQLAGWKTKLKPECYEDLEAHVKMKNSQLKSNSDPISVVRGVELYTFVANWRPDND